MFDMETYLKHIRSNPEPAKPVAPLASLDMCMVFLKDWYKKQEKKERRNVRVNK